MKPFLITILSILVSSGPAMSAEKTSFLRDVAPILLRRCAGCHGPKRAEGNYRVHTFEYLTGAGDSGQATVVNGKPKSSELLRRILSKDADERMPQLDDPLSSGDAEKIRRWIAAGAKFDGKDKVASLRSQLPPRNHPAAPKRYRLPPPVFAMAISPDGKELSIGGYHEVTVWNPRTGKLIRRIGGLPQRIYQMVYTSDGSQLIIGGGSPGEYGELTVVRPFRPAKAEKHRVLGTFEDCIFGIGLDPQEKRVVAVAANRVTRGYQLSSGKKLWQSRLHSDWVTAVSFSADGRFVTSCSKDMTVKVLSSDKGKLFTTYNGHMKQYGKFTGRFRVYSIVSDTQSKQTLSAGEGKTIRVWDPVKAEKESGTAADMEQRFSKEGHTRYIVHGHSKPVYKMVARGGTVLTASADGTVSQFDIKSLKKLRTYSGHRDWVFSVDYHPQAQLVVAGSYDGEIRVWDARNGKTISSFFAAPGHK